MQINPADPERKLNSVKSLQKHVKTSILMANSAIIAVIGQIKLPLYLNRRIQIESGKDYGIKGFGVLLNPFVIVFPELTQLS